MKTIKEWATPPPLAKKLTGYEAYEWERKMSEKQRKDPESKSDPTTKIYADGREGQYFCKCCHCNSLFIGDKRDVNCGECVKSAFRFGAQCGNSEKIKVIVEAFNPDPSQLINPDDCDPHIRRIVERIKKDDHPNVRIYPVSIPDHTVEFDGKTLEEKFQEDFNEQFCGMAIVEDASKVSISMINDVVDRDHIKTWIAQWVLSHGDLSDYFKGYTNTFLENQFQRKP